jgi:hypothetical protein
LEELLEGFGLSGVAVGEEDEGGARLGRGGGSKGEGRRRMNQKGELGLLAKQKMLVHGRTSI